MKIVIKTTITVDDVADVECVVVVKIFIVKDEVVAFVVIDAVVILFTVDLVWVSRSFSNFAERRRVHF